jgi:hypothetical protein
VGHLFCVTNHGKQPQRRSSGWAKKLASPNWLASYVYHIASVTGWGYREITEVLPLAAGMQIIDADLYAKGIQRIYSRDNAKANFDSLRLIDERFSKLQLRQ